MIKPNAALTAQSRLIKSLFDRMFSRVGGIGMGRSILVTLGSMAIKAITPTMAKAKGRFGRTSLKMMARSALPVSDVCALETGGVLALATSAGGVMETFIQLPFENISENQAKTSVPLVGALGNDAPQCGH